MNYKKQHYIPQTYLKSWCDVNKPKEFDDFVWIFELSGDNPKRKSPQNLFHETDLYTIFEEDKKIFNIEHSLSDLEFKFTKIRNDKIHKRLKLSKVEEFDLKMFIAAMNNRTPMVRDHIADTFGRVLNLGKEMQGHFDSMNDNQKKSYVSVGKLSSDDRKLFGLEDIEKFHLKPFETMLIPRILKEVECYNSMHMSFLLTDDKIGFITSDEPVVWFDPDMNKRPAFYQSVGLGYKRVEVTLPISPKALVILSHFEFPDYIEIDKGAVDEINRRTRFHCTEYFVVNCCEKNESWFIEG